MSDRPLKLLLIDPDPIFRTGLRVVVEQSPDLQVVGEAETSADALEILATSTQLLRVDLVVLVCLGGSQPVESGLQCRQIKARYPNLPVLLLSSLQERTYLAAARGAGVDGYCLKGITNLELVAAMRQVADGQSYWQDGGDAENVFTSLPTPGIFATLQNHLRLSGLRQIDASLVEVTSLLKPGLPLLEQVFLAGRRRELLASRWLVTHLLTPRIDQATKEPRLSSNTPAPEANFGQAESLQIAPHSQLSFNLQSALFKSTFAKLQFSLENLTRVPLEIDIFREDKKRELLCLILQKTEDVLKQLRFSQVQQSQLPEMQSVVLRDLWQAVTIDFFGRYSRLQVGDRNLEIVNFLLQDASIVQTAIFNKIPLVDKLFSYLLFQAPLTINNISYEACSQEAMEQAEYLLENLLIHLANAVVQPLLNKMADVEAIKKTFYDSRLISTREIERFRNNLSWKYRLENYIGEPKAIFESRYSVFVLVNRGIAKISIYAPRGEELAQLSGIRLAVTLALETRDAIAPRLKAIVTFLGTGIVYILTQVVGRAIGLIGRGILQGIGGSLPDKFGRNSERPK